MRQAPTNNSDAIAQGRLERLVLGWVVVLAVAALVFLIGPALPWQKWPIAVYQTVVAAVAAACAALLGASTAQAIAERNRLRSELLKEHRATCTAISLAHAVTNSALQYKKQHLTAMVQQFNANKLSFEEVLGQLNSGTWPREKVIPLPFDMRALQVPLPASAELRAHVLDRVTTIVGRPINLAIAIHEEAEALKDAIADRNQWIKGFEERAAKAEGPPAQLQVACGYFGIPAKSGITDTRYADLLHGAALHCDCMIWFGIQLADDLAAHGADLVARWNGARLGLVAGQLLKAPYRVDFNEARTDGLVPPDEDFAQWSRAFKQLESA